jgi:hypothetical protein
MKKLFLGTLLLLSISIFSQEQIGVGSFYSPTTKIIGIEIISNDLDKDIIFGGSVGYRFYNINSLEEKYLPSLDGYKVIEIPNMCWSFLVGTNINNKVFFLTNIGFYNNKDILRGADGKLREKGSDKINPLIGGKILIKSKKFYYGSGYDNLNGTTLSLGLFFN